MGGFSATGESRKAGVTKIKVQNFVATGIIGVVGYKGGVVVAGGFRPGTDAARFVCW